uniref:Uncharacterized protein n=1 Tax=Rousettus aegyptiacus TaxID=9407 RepID=A0A7J8BEW0_ROUAE|nr:hypothetical protein HJG63_009882 [Rousettus aegyptiacus]
MLKNFEKDYSGDYGVKLTPQKLHTLCEINWPPLGVRWPAGGALDKGSHCKGLSSHCRSTWPRESIPCLGKGMEYSALKTPVERPLYGHFVCPHFRLLKQRHGYITADLNLQLQSGSVPDSSEPLKATLRKETLTTLIDQG